MRVPPCRTGPCERAYTAVSSRSRPGRVSGPLPPAYEFFAAQRRYHVLTRVTMGYHISLVPTPD